MRIPKDFLFLYYLLFIGLTLHAQGTEDDLSKLTYAELDSLVMIPYSRGDYEGAIRYMKQGVEKSKAEFGTRDTIYTQYLNNLGFFYNETGQYLKSEKLFLELVEILKETTGEWDDSYAQVLNNLAFVYQKMGKYDLVEPIYFQVKDIWNNISGDTTVDYAASLNNIAGLYQMMENYEQAEPLYLEALAIKEKVLGNEHFEYARALNNLAGLYELKGQSRLAAPLFLQTAEIRKKIFGDKHPIYAQSLNNLAFSYNKTGKNLEAEKLYLQALSIRRESLGKQHPSYASALNNLATLYIEMKKYRAAELMLSEALIIWEKSFGKGHFNYVRCLNTLAVLYKEVNDLDKAFAYNLSSIAYNAVSFEETFPTLFDLKESITELDESFDNFEPSRCCGETQSIGFLKLASLEFNNQLAMSSSCITLSHITKAQYLELVKKESKSSPKAKDKLVQHYNVCKAAMKINETIRNSFSGDKGKLRVLKENGLFVELGIGAAFDFGEPTTFAEAFSFAEQNKSMLLADAVKGNRARNLGDLPDSLVLKEIALQQKKDRLKKQKIEAKSPEAKALVVVAENELNIEINSFLKSLKNKYPQYHALKYESIIATAKDIQNLLDEQSILIEYFIADRITYLFAVTKTKVALHPINITKKYLGIRIKELRNALSDYKYIVKNKNKSYEQYTQTAHWFFKEMLAPALEDTTLENLIIIADGELGHLPFEAFLVEQATQKLSSYRDLHYLINDFNVSYNYSATLWKESNDAHFLSHNNNHQMLACASAYPDLDKDSFLFRPAHVFNQRQRLNPLPNAQNEVAELSKYFQGDFLQNDSTNEAFFKENASKYGIIHLAMHGILHKRVPMLSSLAFTENGDSTEDNFLQAYEISRLKLNADLVVLSACETGYGKFEQGEGIISLARSFMYAGTPSLVVSLWQVNDLSTAIIMQHFYQYLADGLSKDVALRQAKLDYLKLANGLMAHPAFWSPFIQLGDSRSIELATKGGGDFRFGGLLEVWELSC